MTVFVTVTENLSWIKGFLVVLTAMQIRQQHRVVRRNLGGWVYTPASSKAANDLATQLR